MKHPFQTGADSKWRTNQSGNYSVWLLLCLLSLLPSGLPAKQLEFNQVQQGEQILLSYVWQNASNEEQYLKFSLPSKVLLDSSRSFQHFSPQFMMREMEVQLQKAIYQQYPSVTLQLLPGRNEVGYRLQGKNQAELSKAELLAQQTLYQAQQEYLEKKHLREFTDPFGRRVLIPDHSYFFNDALNHLQPVARAIKKQLPEQSKHRVISHLISLVQTIPYAVLGKRGENDYLPPLSVIKTNRGDCDSKAVLLAALIHSVYPQLPLAMIYLPEHALLGIQLGEKYPLAPVRIAGQSWLLAEAAGPAQLPLGKVSADTQAQLDRNISKILRLRPNPAKKTN